MAGGPPDFLGWPLDGWRLVEASAGTGKTWNICGLVLRLLLERRLDVGQVLVVTFTNAATAELRERIRSRMLDVLRGLDDASAAVRDPFVHHLLAELRGAHGCSDDEMRQRLDVAVRNFDEASIFTIHGFCQRALADAPFSAGMPLASELLADDAELRREVVNDLWRRRVAGQAPPAALAAAILRHRDSPGRWDALLRRRLAKPLAQMRWPQELDAAADPQLGSAAAQDALAALRVAHAAARGLWQRARADVLACVEEALPRLNRSVWREGSMQKAAQQWDAWLANADALQPHGEEDRLHLFTPPGLKPRKNEAPVQPHAFFEAAQALLDAARALAAEGDRLRLGLIRELLTEGPRALARAKRERRAIAFGDMLANLHERLGGASGPALAASLRARFPVALIDEFQDTDPLQLSIFETIYPAHAGAASPPCVFLVGDPKQAIYSFRHADLHTYLAARGKVWGEHSLAENQRSTGPLIDALNAFFGRNPAAFMLPGLDYRPVALGAKPRDVLEDRRSGADTDAALRLWSLPCDEQGRPLPKAQAAQAAIDACAGEIARLVEAGQRGEVVLAGRPLSAGDIAVLVRSHAQGSRVRAALAALGVGSVELSQAGIFESVDARELERLLAAIMEPSKPRLLRAALATDLMGFDAAAIEALGADDAKWSVLVERMTTYRESWLARGAGPMLRQWMSGEGVAQRLLSRPDGERRMTNLLHLVECVQQAGDEHASPESLLRWLRSALLDPQTDEALQLRLESDRHLVQVVTVHKSKGLEYPIVFCPMLWDGRAAQQDALPDGVEYHDPQDGAVIDFRPDAATDAVKASQRLDRDAETLRLIYVALTRAVHRCHLVVGSYAKATRSAKGGTSSTRESARSLLNWLAAGAGCAPAAWSENDLDPAAIAAAWAALAREQAPRISLGPLPEPPQRPVQLPLPAPDSIAAREAPRVPPAWAMSSYSSLTRGARHEGAAADHDAAASTTVSPSAAGARAASAEPADDDILRFPRGPVAGECMHAVLEHADFGNAESWPAAIERGLALVPLTEAGARPAAPASAASAAPAASPPALRRMLQRMLGDVLATPLPGGFALNEVPAGRRLVELEFSLPVRGLAMADLQAAMHEHGYPAAELATRDLRGYLRGFIDLVFEHEGRFHIVDWKSNHLGTAPEDYRPAALADAMSAQGYHLQYLLYTLAVHRWLASRLPGYDYDRHFGSVFYLFVRGVRPGWLDARGEPCGVFRNRPPRALVERLSRLFDEPRTHGAWP